MKKALRFVAMVALMCMPLAMHGQQEIVIGSGTTNSNYLPGYNFYNYSLSQQIYTAAEIGTPGVITSVAFKNTGETKTRTYHVYLALTNKTEFTSNSDWVSVAAGDEVFSGSLTFTSGQWTTIQLTTPFMFDGVNNLLVTVADETGGYSSSPHMACLVFDATNQALYKYRDNAAFDVAAPAVDGTRPAFKNQITLGIIPGGLSCWPVMNLAAVDSLATTTSITIGWADTNNVGAIYDVYSISDTDTVMLAMGLTGFTYTANNLAPMTEYAFGVMSNCGGGDYANMGTVTCRTACATVVVDDNNPFTEGFEGNEFPPACWSTAHTAGSSTLVWQSQTATVHSGIRSAKLPDMQQGNKTNLVTPPISIDAVNNYRVSFWMFRTASSLANEGVKVWVNTTPDTVGGTALIHVPRSYSQGPLAESAAGWYQYSAIIPQSMAASEFYVVFEGISEYGNYSSLDDVTIDRAPNCLPVTGLDLIGPSLTAHTATLVWSSSGSSFQVEYKQASDTVWTVETVNDTVAELTGLLANTAYNFRVKVLCGSEESDYSSEITFATAVACPAPTNLRAVLTPGDGTVATLTWNDPTGSTWQICFNDDTNNLITVYDNYYDFTNLTPETAYTAQVRRDCTDEQEGYSMWTPAISFTPTDAYTITVNDGQGTNNMVPVYGLYTDEYSRSQFILSANDLTQVLNGDINKLVFYADASNISWGAAQFKVYVTETGANTLSTLTTWTDMQQVYEGSLSIVNGEMEVVFDTTYHYLGGNLLIGINQTVLGTYLQSYWLGVSAISGASIGGYGTSTNPQSFLPKTTITFTPGVAPDCMPVSNLTIVDSLTASDSLTISWEDNANSNATYTIYTIAGTDTTVVATTGDNSYTFDELSPNTVYTFGVEVNCGTNTGLLRTVSGKTACGRVTPPYTWDFEQMEVDESPECWTKVGTGYNLIAANNSYNTLAHGGQHALQFASSTNNIIVLPELTVEANTLQMRIWIRPLSNTTASGNFEVGYVTDITDPATFTAVGTFNYAEFFTTGGGVYGMRTVMFTGVPNSVRMALRAAPSATWYQWFVDDVTVEEIPTCAPVNHLAAVDSLVTAESITISWESDANSFVVLNMADTTVIGTTSDTSYMIANLSPSGQYTFGVVVDCGGDYSDTVVVTVGTACSAIAIPYYEDFEPTSVTIGCWSLVDVASSSVFTATNGIDNGGCFSFSYNTNPPQYLISPELSGTDNDSIMVEFRYKAGSTTWHESFAVGYSTTTNGTEAFTWLPEVTGINNDVSFTVYSHMLPVGVKYVCIKYTANDQLRLFIDSVYIGVPAISLTVDVTVGVNDSVMGSATGGGSYAVGDTATLSATANEGYHFVNWTQNGNVLSSDNPFLMVVDSNSGSYPVIANFAMDSIAAEDTLTVTLAVNDATLGGVNPAPGTYAYVAADSIVYNAMPDSGNYFVAWLVVFDNGNTDSVYASRYAVLAGDVIDAGVANMTVTAVFRSGVGIGSVDADVSVYSSANRIVVRGAEGETIGIYDLNGRTVAIKANAAEVVEFIMPDSGVYMVKVGDAPARRVLVVR